MRPELHLTPEESALVENSAWLITKQRIVGKVYGLFGLLSEKYNEVLQGYTEFIPEEVIQVSPKIYKGEMYRQLPYVMLDHPRYFSQADSFSIRNFFWWGNHFSIHLVLSGKYKVKYAPALAKHIEEGSLDDWYLGAAEDPWEHHFEEDNYLPIHSLKKKAPAQMEASYIKIGKWFPLDQWKDSYSFFLTSYTELLECLV